jgi:hypothetical protein
MDDIRTPSVCLPHSVNEGEWDSPLTSPQPESLKGKGVGVVVSVVCTVGGRCVLFHHVKTMTLVPTPQPPPPLLLQFSPGKR